MSLNCSTKYIWIWYNKQNAEGVVKNDIRIYNRLYKYENEWKSRNFDFYFYELRVKHNLSESKTKRFLELAQIRLENLGYKIYKTGEKFIYVDIVSTVKENELMVAVKK